MKILSGVQKKLPKNKLFEIEQLAKKKLVFFCQKFPQTLSLEDRRQFRQFLVQSIQKQAFYKENSKFMDLKPLLKTGLKPQQDLMALSISHCKNLALFAFTFKKNEKENLSIGIDIEESQRVSKALVSRISQEQEYYEFEKSTLQPPKPSLLWAAKEASFKAFSGKKALLISECRIFSWKKSKENYYFQSSYKAQKAQGIAFFWNRMTLAYAQSL